MLTKIAKSVEALRRPIFKMTGLKLNKNAAINAKRRPSIYIRIFLCPVVKLLSITTPVVSRWVSFICLFIPILTKAVTKDIVIIENEILIFEESLDNKIFDRIVASRGA